MNICSLVNGFRLLLYQPPYLIYGCIIVRVVQWNLFWKLAENVYSCLVLLIFSTSIVSLVPVLNFFLTFFIITNILWSRDNRDYPNSSSQT